MSDLKIVKSEEVETINKISNKYGDIRKAAAKLKPGKSIVFPIPEGRTFQQMYNCITVNFSHNAVKAPDGMYFHKSESKDRKNLVITLRVRGAKGFGKVKKIRASKGKKPAKVLKKDKKELKRLRDARYRANKKKKLQTAA